MNRNFRVMSNLFHNGKDSSDDLFESWSYSKENYILFTVGIITIILGYVIMALGETYSCLLYTSPSPRDVEESRMPSSA